MLKQAPLAFYPRPVLGGWCPPGLDFGAPSIQCIAFNTYCIIYINSNVNLFSQMFIKACFLFLQHKHNM